MSGGGGGTRLLADYPRKQREEIYDLLFKPQWGASLHVLKVEVGCDGDTTQGAEQTHMRTQDDASPTAFSRGYENELMLEARLRNPSIHLSGLEWGVPAWVVASSGGSSIFTQENQDYLVAWIKGLQRQYNGTITIDSLGVAYNERGYNKTWIIQMKERLVAEGLGNVSTIAADLCCGSQYSIANDMRNDPKLRGAVDIIGTHCPGPLNGQYSPDPAMLDLGKPFWNTEQHFGVPDGNPAGCYDWEAFVGTAQVLNRNYVDAKHVSVLMWTPIYSWYDWLAYPGKGLFSANQPWSGYYNASGNTPLWALAHTTQFTQPGWRFLGASFNCSAVGSPCGSLGGNAGDGYAGSYVAYGSPDNVHLTLVIETFGATGATAFSIELRGAWATKTWFTWTSKHGATFIRDSDPLSGSHLSIVVPANELWTLTTVPGGRKGTDGVTVPEPKPFPLYPKPFFEDFDALSEDSLAPYFSDMNGAFSTGVTGLGEGRGKVLIQHTTHPPHATHGGRKLQYFAVAIGDSTMSSYRITVDMQADQKASRATLFLGSHSGSNNIKPEAMFDTLTAGVVFIMNLDRTAKNASWELRSGGSLLNHGAGEVWTPGTWYTVRLSVQVQPNTGMPGYSVIVSVEVNGEAIGGESRFEGADSFTGPAYMGSGHHQAFYDNVKIEVIQPNALTT